MVGGVHGAHLPILSGIRDQGAGHAKSDKLVYCHEALHLKEKAQHAGYKALVEKWDTDSDSSDGSDDELDLAV